MWRDWTDRVALGVAKAVTKTTGRPPYAPADLLKRYLYGYLHRIRSSRRLEAECQRNVEVMWRLGRLAPDHQTIADCRRLNHKGFTALCRAFVQFCRQAGLVTGELVARGPRVAYNVQTAVDARHALIVHHEVTQDGADNRQ